MQHKLHMLWLSWSDIRKNEKLSKMVNPSKKDSDDVIALKEAFILLLDRTGRVLCDTDLLEELKYQLETFNVEEVVENLEDFVIKNKEI